MKIPEQYLTIFLQIVLILFGLAVVAALLLEPHFEGRNVGATLFEIYFTDPFLAFVYLGSLPFFAGLYQAFKLLGYVRQNTIFSSLGVRALKIIKYCALTTAVLIVAANVYLKIAARGEDDPAGAIMLGIIATFISLVVASVATVFERILGKIVR